MRRLCSRYLRTGVRNHPGQRILERVHRWYTSSDLWRATEIYLNLWGSAYWAVERDEHGQPEIWPLRPDRVSIVPDRREYVRGFVYNGRNGPVATLPTRSYSSATSIPLKSMLACRP